MKKLMLLANLVLAGNLWAQDFAIKLNLTDDAKSIISKEIVAAATYNTSDLPDLIDASHLHVTIGYVTGLQNDKEASLIKLKAKEFLSEYLKKNPLVFEVSMCEGTKFKTVNFAGFTALVPTSKSEEELKTLNQKLEEMISQLFVGKTSKPHFNGLTTNSRYVPHMTLKKSSTGPNRVASMNKKIEELKKNRDHGKLFFTLRS